MGWPKSRVYSAPAEQLRMLDGDPRFLKRLIEHPALNMIERLDEREKRKAELAEKLAILGSTLAQANEQISGIGWDIAQEKSLERKAAGWITRLRESMRNADHVRIGLSAEQYRQGNGKRRGLFAVHHERYFYAAFLIPYTAFLRQKKGELAAPDWELIEEWLRNISRSDKEQRLRLRTWWGKEVLQRKSRPSPTILYALAAGASIYLENSAGRRAKWIVEQDHLGRPLSSEEHPKPVKRSLNAQDRAYLCLALKYVPLARASFLRFCPQAKDLMAGLPPNPIDALAKKRTEEIIDKLPARLRLRIAGIRGEKVDTKAIFRAAKAAVVKANGKRRRKTSKTADAPAGKFRAA
ncbi:MAG TPA: hypothetical protein DCZ01_11320 [Elusimicrobia bacterium]|nr:hypothetical protein [Elusimicrobiota bacterium]